MCLHDLGTKPSQFFCSLKKKTPYLSVYCFMFLYFHNVPATTRTPAIPHNSVVLLRYTILPRTSVLLNLI